MDFLPKNKTIIYAVLNWGLGHATRSIPLIEKLIQQNNKVIIAADGIALEYLKNHFNNNQTYELPAYDMLYPYDSILKNLLVQFYKPIRAIKQENSAIEKLSFELKADYIISDNRYGCYSSRCKNIIITHQIEPYHQNKLIKYIFKISNRRFLKPFNEIWIPDDENIKLSGTLSNDSSGKLNIKFIGILSRMIPCKAKAKDEKYITFLLSGPEPQRTKLEVDVLKLVDKNSNHNFILIRGTNNGDNLSKKENLSIINLASTQDVNDILCQSKLVICRSGYSTLMDLYTLDRKAIIIPTIGQTEQEYLAEYNSKRWHSIDQTKINSNLLEKFI